MKYLKTFNENEAPFAQPDDPKVSTEKVGQILKNAWGKESGQFAGALQYVHGMLPGPKYGNEGTEEHTWRNVGSGLAKTFQKLGKEEETRLRGIVNQAFRQASKG